LRNNGITKFSKLTEFLSGFLDGINSAATPGKDKVLTGKHEGMKYMKKAF
jgi:hypothetical protein